MSSLTSSYAGALIIASMAALGAAYLGNSASGTASASGTGAPAPTAPEASTLPQPGPWKKEDSAPVVDTASKSGTIEPPVQPKVDAPAPQTATTEKPVPPPQTETKEKREFPSQATPDRPWLSGVPTKHGPAIEGPLIGDAPDLGGPPEDTSKNAERAAALKAQLDRIDAPAPPASTLPAPAPPPASTLPSPEFTTPPATGNIPPIPTPPEVPRYHQGNDPNAFVLPPGADPSRIGQKPTSGDPELAKIQAEEDARKEAEAARAFAEENARVAAEKKAEEARAAQAAKEAEDARAAKQAADAEAARAAQAAQAAQAEKAAKEAAEAQAAQAAQAAKEEQARQAAAAEQARQAAEQAAQAAAAERARQATEEQALQAERDAARAQYMETSRALRRASQSSEPPGPKRFETRPTTGNTVSLLALKKEQDAEAERLRASAEERDRQFKERESAMRSAQRERVAAIEEQQRVQREQEKAAEQAQKKAAEDARKAQEEQARAAQAAAQARKTEEEQTRKAQEEQARAAQAAQAAEEARKAEEEKARHLQQLQEEAQRIRQEMAERQARIDARTTELASKYMSMPAEQDTPQRPYIGELNQRNAMNKANEIVDYLRDLRAYSGNNQTVNKERVQLLDEFIRAMERAKFARRISPQVDSQVRAVARNKISGAFRRTRRQQDHY